MLVPIDYRTSPDFLLKVAGIVDAKAILVGEAVDAVGAGDARPIWNLAEMFRSKPDAQVPRTTDPPTSDLRRTSRPTTTAEIIFTSGATAEPKGVVLTHKNILANIVPIEREMAKYQKYTRPFRPIRFLNLLPLSHMFGQAMATFVPPMLPGVVVFTRSYSPDDIVRQIRERRISVLVCVPKILEVLRDYIIRVAPEAAEPPPRGDALGEAVVALPADPQDVRVQVLGDGGRRRAARSRSSRRSGDGWDSSSSRATA